MEEYKILDPISSSTGITSDTALLKASSLSTSHPNGIPVETRHCCDRRRQRSRCKWIRDLASPGSLCLTLRISWNGSDSSARIPTTSSSLWSATPTPRIDSSPFSDRRSLRSRGMSSTLIRFRYAQSPHVTPLTFTANPFFRPLSRISPRLEVEKSIG